MCSVYSSVHPIPVMIAATVAACLASAALGPSVLLSGLMVGPVISNVMARLAMALETLATLPRAMVLPAIAIPKVVAVLVVPADLKAPAVAAASVLVVAVRRRVYSKARPSLKAVAIGPRRG